MPEFGSFDATRLHYDIEGDGPPVVLLHGFASTSFINWVRPGLAKALTAAGLSVIMPDARGHGLSDKPHAVEAYTGEAMTRDCSALLDHLGLDSCAVAGYSMGARTGLALVLDDPRINRAVLGGTGDRLLNPPNPDRELVASALETDDPGSVTDRTARGFRDFADRTKADRFALAACWRAGRRRFSHEELAKITSPVLVLAAEGDPVIGSPQALARAIPGAELRLAQGTHLNVINSAAYRDAMVEFLSRD
ncbi:MAG TPA: alpha/beta hydrolase [Actinomycetota bacterium]|nr:alpha/beta hydrolase [Actinomycetota bacterium]